MLRLTFLACLCLPGCIDVPELDSAVPDWVDASDYPELVSLDGVQAGLPPGKAAEDLEDELTARASRLRRKADELNRPVVDPNTQARMSDGVQP